MIMHAGRKYFLWSVFLLALLGVIFGWLLVIQRLFRNDVQVAQAKVREAEERYLNEMSVNLEGLDFGPFSDLAVLRLIQSNRASGVWSEQLSEPADDANPVTSWPVDPAQSSAELIGRKEQFPWGHIKNGRDRLGALLLKFAREEGEEFAGRDLLESGLLGSYQPGFEVSSGFRLVMIRELMRSSDSELLARLKLAEEIRAVEGQLSELDVQLEVLEKDGVSLFFNQEQMLELIRGDRNVRLSLSAEPPEDRSWVRLGELQHWPYLSLSEGLPVGNSALVKSERTIWYLGALTMISTLAVIGVAIWIGRQELLKARARTDLAASVAHELRTPLAGQRVILESLQKRQEYDDEYVGLALNENERLGDLAEEFLTFSRLERGVLEVQLRPFNLADVLQSLVAGFREQWDEGELICEFKDGLVMADEAAVATIARNLIENAWKYSDPPRKIHIRTVDDEKGFGFSVSDQGIGLSRRDQKKIFQQFYRVDQRLSRSRDGLGIGLSIVRRLVDAVEGSLEIESELGKGSTFSVYLQQGGPR